MIKARDAIATARALIGTPYAQLDCINLIKAVIRTAPGGVPGYTTAGTNTLWRSYEASGKYRDLTWRGETSSVSPSAIHLPQRGRLSPPRAGMLAFKRTGNDVHHVGIVTGDGTVIHSSSAQGGRGVVETELDGSWQLLAIHRYIETAGEAEREEDEDMATLYRAIVTTQKDPLRVRDAPKTGRIIGQVPRGKTVDVLSEGEWPRIRYNEVVGYASASYLARVDEDVEDPDEDTDVESAEPTTTLMREDGMVIVLAGRWHVAYD